MRPLSNKDGPDLSKILEPMMMITIMVGALIYGFKVLPSEPMLYQTDIDHDFRTLQQIILDKCQNG